MKKLITVVLLAGFAFTCHAEISANCNIVLAQSAVTFSKIDEIKEGFTEENPAPQEAVEAFIDAEVIAMVDMYRAGAATLLQGATRAEAEQFITESVAQVDSGVDEDLQTKARQAAVDAFMCGYDDQLKSS